MKQATSPSAGEWLREKRLAVVTGVSSLALVGMASAATLNDSIAPIISSVTLLFTPLLATIIAAVPLIIALAVIGFILGIFSAILSKLQI